VSDESICGLSVLPVKSIEGEPCGGERASDLELLLDPDFFDLGTS
jgi:hypothetical protein